MVRRNAAINRLGDGREKKWELTWNSVLHLTYGHFHLLRGVQSVDRDDIWGQESLVCGLGRLG